MTSLKFELNINGWTLKKCLHPSPGDVTPPFVASDAQMELFDAGHVSKDQFISDKKLLKGIRFHGHMQRSYVLQLIGISNRQLEKKMQITQIAQ